MMLIAVGRNQVVRQIGGLTQTTGRCSSKLSFLTQNLHVARSIGNAEASIGNSCVQLWNRQQQPQQLRWSSFFRMDKSPPPQIESSTTETKEEAEEVDTSDFSFAMGSHLPKLKPHIVQKRLKALRTYEGGHKKFRHSPWRLNLTCSLAARCATVEESLAQLEFCNKQKSKGLVMKVIRRTANLADMRDCLQPSQLEVAHCFATKGKHLPRLKIMGRGRAGLMHHKFSHMRVVLREIDFPLKVYQAPTMGEKRLWLDRYKRAKRQFGVALQEREELERLQKEAEKSAEQARSKK